MSTVVVSPAGGAAAPEAQMVSPADAAAAARAAPLTAVPSSAVAGIDYMGYERLLQAAWKDLPNLTIEYRDLAYIRRVPVNKTDVETLATVAASWFTKFKSTPMRDYPALQPCSGTVLPGTMTLVLAPPGHGKSTFLKALGGRYHDDPLQRGQVLFNGVSFKEARAKGLDINRMTAYVDQGDVHMPLLTVRETFQFALDNCVADPTLLNSPDLKKVHEKKVDLVLELLGLKECESTIIGNEMLRGVSGGQKRRVTIGEMLITNARLLLLDEITTGLDSAASFDILNAVRQWTRLMHGSCVSALLQPTPECFALFDRLVLLRQGHVIYDGPVDRVQAYFESIGIPVPDDQDLADFLTDFLNDPKMIYMRGLYRRARKTEISVTRSQGHGHGPDGPVLEPHQPEAGAYGATAEDGGIKPEQKDAEEAVMGAASGDLVVPVGRTGSKPGSFHHQASVPLKARSPSDFHKIASSVVAPKAPSLPTDVVPLTTTGLVAAFKASSYNANIQADLQRLQGERPKLSSFSREAMTPYSQQQFSASSSLPFLQHTVYNFGRQWKNMTRNSSLVGPRIFNSFFVALVLGSLFYQLNPNEYASRLGLCLFACVHIAFVNQVELPYSAEAKLVIFKQADAGFYPVFSYALSVVVVHLVLAITESVIFSVILYYMAGFDPDGGRWLFFTYVLLMCNLAMSTLFRWISYMVRFQDVAEQLAGPSTALCMIFGGFLITKNNVPDWFIWAYWMSPFTWAFTSLAQNEFYSPRYPDLRYLQTFEIPTDNAYKWSGIGYLTGLFLVFYVFSTLALAYKRFPLTIGTSRVLADEEEEEALASKPDEQVKTGEPVKMDMLRRYASSYRAKDGSTALPFEPIDLAWRDIKYTVTVKDDNGKSMDRVLLNGINGYARAGTLTALMGSSGAGKTTLMDVIAGRKTAGKMEGQIMINGYPTAPQVFQRLMGYVEQTDVHLPTQTVREALRFSARLRLPREVPDEQMFAFVEEVLDILELTPIADRLIGDVSLPSLSPGQLKRVTIGVELVANPPLLFLDEPTSGLDSRAALIVMRVVKRIAQTGRAVVCTIHQPSAELFYMFDRLLLLRSGGLEVFFGDLGEFGSNLVEYFESAPVKEDFRYKLPPRTNPASWMLEVIGAGTGAKLKAKGYTKADLPDYAEVYKVSKLREESMAVLQEVSQPKPGTAPLKLESQYASSMLMQYYMVTSRLFQFYWRNTAFTMTRFYLMVFLALVFGLLYLDVGQNSQSAVISKLACVFLTLGFPGIVVCSSSLPVLSRQRAVFYREQSSIMYSSFAYTVALTLAEVVYTAISAFLFHIPVYFMVGFLNDGSAFFKYWLVLYLSMLFFAYMGQFLIAALPNKLAATIVQGLLATFIFLFGGVFIQSSVMPVGWKWVYYMDFLPKALIAVGVSQFECMDDGSAYCREIDVTQGGNVVQMTVQDYVGLYLDTGYGMYWKYVGWIILTTFVMRALGALAISFVNHQKR